MNVPSAFRALPLQLESVSQLNDFLFKGQDRSYILLKVFFWIAWYRKPLSFMSRPTGNTDRTNVPFKLPQVATSFSVVLTG